MAGTRSGDSQGGWRGSGPQAWGGLAGRARKAAAAVGTLVALGACAPEDTPSMPPKPPETLAVEEKAGDFLAYFEEVIVLSRRYAAHADSFQTALDDLPGSHLTDEEWEAWTAPYRDDPRSMTIRLETTIANLGRQSRGN